MEDVVSATPRPFDDPIGWPDPGRPPELSPALRRRAVRFTTACALAGTGVVVNGFSVNGRGGPFTGVGAVSSPVRWTGYQVLLLLVPAMAFVLGLVLSRWWRWLLLAGALATVPAVLLEFRSAGETQFTSVLALAGAPLVLVAMLAGAQELIRSGATGSGTAVAGVAIAAPLFGDILLGAHYLRQPPDLPVWHTVLLAIGVAGGLAAVGSRFRPDLAPGSEIPTGRGSWSGLRATVAGAVAGCLVFVPPLLDDRTLAGLLGVHLDALHRRQYAANAVVGLVLVVAALLLAAVAGGWALAGVVTVAVLLVAMTDPLILGEYPVAFHPGLGRIAGLLGIALAAGFAATKWRVPAAVAGALGCAITLFIMYGATGGFPEKLIDQQAATLGALLLGALTFTTTAVAAAVAPVLASRATLPSVLGPVVLAVAGGGRAVLSATELHNGLPESSYFNGLHHLTSSATLLLVAAVMVAGLTVAGVLIDRLPRRAVPGV
jgi:hypothetical protein